MEEKKAQLRTERHPASGGRGRTVFTVFFCLLLAALAGFVGYSLRNLYRYERAVSLLKESKYSEAAEAFDALRDYRDAASYQVYCRAAQAGEEGNYRIASANLKALNGFSDSALLGIYYEARACEETGDYESAEPLYLQISLFRDAGERLAALPGLMQERDYQNACALQEQGSLQAALSAFRMLNDYKDSNLRREEIAALISEQENREAYEAAEELARKGSLQEAAEAFLALGKYRDSEDRAADLQGQLEEQENARKEKVYQEALKAEEAGDALTARPAYLSLGEYRDSAARASGLKNEYDYQKAWQDFEEGACQQARDLYLQLGEYKDSADRAETLWIVQQSELTGLGTGLASYRLEGKYGLINLQSHRVTVAKYDTIGTYDASGMAPVSLDGRVGFIDESGDEVIPIRYRQAGLFDENGLCSVQNESGSYGCIDRAGMEVIPCQYSDISAFRDGVCIVRKDGLLGVMNTKGNAVTEVVYLMLGDTSAGDRRLRVPSFDGQDRIRVSDVSGAYALMDRQYRVIGDFVWEEIGEFREGLARVRAESGYGFINPQGETVIPAEWKQADEFSDGLCVVRDQRGRSGYIDTAGELVIPAVYETATRFKGGYAAVYLSGVGWYMIDRQGANTRFTVVPYEHAAAALEKGDYESAAAGFYALGDYGDAYQQMLETYYRQAMALRESGNLADAYLLASQLSDYAQYRDSGSLATAVQADRLYEEGKTSEAWTLYAQVDEGLRRHQEDYQAGFEAADALLKAGDYDGAIVAFRALGGFGESEERIRTAYDGKYESEFAAASELMAQQRYDEAIAGFEALGEYSRAREMVAECKYLKALSEEKKGKPVSAVRMLRELGSYGDAEKQAARIEAETLFAGGLYADAWNIYATLEEAYHAHDADYARMYEEAAARLSEGQFDEAEAGFTALGTYGDSAARVEACREGRRAADYDAAKALLEAGQYEEAGTAFTKLGTYGDSEDMVVECIYRRAVALTDAGQFDEAAGLLTGLMDHPREIPKVIPGDSGAKDAEELLKHTGYRDAPMQLCRLIADARFAKGEYGEAWEIYSLMDDTDYHTHEKEYLVMYDAAAQMATEGKYGEAEQAFLALGGYRDSRQRAADAAQAALEAVYQQARALQEQGQFDEAYDMYASLGEYSDSRSKLLEVAGQKADHLYGEGRYAEAAEVYRLLNLTEQAQAADWHEAERLKQAGDYPAASAKWMSIRDYGDSRAQNYAMAAELAEAGDSLRAISIFLADPDYEDARERVYQIGTAAHDREAYDVAIAAWKALDAYKDSGMNLTMDTYAYGGQLYDAGRFDEAAAVFEAMNGFSNTAERAKDSAYQAAKTALENGEYADAESRFAALKDYQDSQTMVKEARYRAAKREMEAGEYASALSRFQGLKDYQDSRTQAQAAVYALGDLAFTAGEYREAAERFRSILGYGDAGTRWQQARYMLYGEELAAGSFDQAIEGFETLTAEGVADAAAEARRAHYLKARSLDERGKTEAAYHEYVSAADHEDAADLAKARAYTLGTELQGQERYPEAIPWLERAADFSDAREQLYRTGSFYFSTQDYQHAVCSFKTLAGYKDASDYLERIGVYYEMQSDPENACLAYGYACLNGKESEKAAALKSELEGRADAYLAAGKTGEALRLYATLAKVDAGKKSKMNAVSFLSFMKKCSGIKIGNVRWQNLAWENGNFVLISNSILGNVVYRNSGYETMETTITEWMRSAPATYFTEEERAFISMFIPSKGEIEKYKPSGSTTASAWTFTENTSTYRNSHYIYKLSEGEQGRFSYQNDDSSCGIRPGIRFSYNSDTYRMLQDSSRYTFYDQTGKETRFTPPTEEDGQLLPFDYEVPRAVSEYRVYGAGAAYSFSRSGNGYYVSENKGRNSSCALCRIDFTTTTGVIYLDCINYAESGCDYGIISRLDQTLSTGTGADGSANVFMSFNSGTNNKSGIQTVRIPVGDTEQHTVYVKFIKDGSVHSNNDTLQFKVRFE